MNIREIAKRARVSTATVSRTINRIPSVQPQLAKRVWRAVEELGYFPNTQARALVSGRSRTFGLIVSEITNPFFPEIVHVFEETALQHNYEILLTSTVHDPERMKISVRRMLERRVEGVAVMTFGMEESLLDDLKLRNVPLVFVDVAPPRPRVSNIRIDYLHGIRQAVQHLAALRHDRIAFITGPLTLKSAVARRDAFTQSMTEIGLAVDPRFIVEGNHTLEGGEEAFAKLLKLALRPTAVLCSNDMTAIGVMRKSYGEKIEVPRRDFHHWLRQYSLLAIHSAAFDDHRDVPGRTCQARIPCALERRSVRDSESEWDRVRSANQSPAARDDCDEPQERSGNSPCACRNLNTGKR